jgi:hypothetical protein
MEWNNLFDSNLQPSFEDMENYIGGDGAALWKDLFAHMQATYAAKPKLSYSVCSGKPGWNVKFAKSGVSFGTLYPEENTFSVFIVIAYKLDDAMEAIKPRLSGAMRERFETAPDFMKNGRWMMFQIANRQDLDDYKLLMSAKMPPKKGA